MKSKAQTKSIRFSNYSVIKKMIRIRRQVEAQSLISGLWAFSLHLTSDGTNGSFRNTKSTIVSGAVPSYLCYKFGWGFREILY